MAISISVANGQGHELARAEEADEAFLVYQPAYAEGDVIAVRTGGEDIFLVVRLDETMPPSLVLCRGELRLPIPFGNQRQPYSLRAFIGELHVLQARRARPEEIAGRQNLCLNPYDHRDNRTSFPHATANVETRGEAQFFARNAIDGEKSNNDHGLWPYTSWGINRDPNAELTVEFGRSIEVDEAVVYLRADFPHDAWWQQATLAFSDDSEETVALSKTGKGQAFRFAPRIITSVRLCRLIKADDPSPFPALTQIELWGRNVI